jgi:hypothetical protein
MAIILECLITAGIVYSLAFSTILVGEKESLVFRLNRGDYKRLACDQREQAEFVEPNSERARQINGSKVALFHKGHGFALWTTRKRESLQQPKPYVERRRDVKEDIRSIESLTCVVEHTTALTIVLSLVFGGILFGIYLRQCESRTQKVHFF